jgi:2-polyprenyl-3-methyl-5-hydroxy-6-metoxy-1,4-benzoquinol methylase
MATTLAADLRGCENMRILDYGAGSGEFENEMRIRGYPNVASFDPYSSSSSRRAPDGLFDIIIMSEVVEHSPKPLEMLSQVCNRLSPSGSIIISQSLQPNDIERIRGNWWYIGPRNGHVCFFSERTFMLMAAKLGLTYYRGRHQLYGFARPTLAFPVARALNRLGRSVHQLEIELLASNRDEKNWHSLEQAEGRDFRWSKTSEISWPRVPFAELPTTVVVPFLLEIREGFAGECVIAVDRQPLNTTVHKKGIIARVGVGTGIHSVQLLTPVPLVPKAMRGGHDDRPLGLAVIANS